MNGLIDGPQQGQANALLCQSEKTKFTNPELITLAINCAAMLLPKPSFMSSHSIADIDATDFSSKMVQVYNTLKTLNDIQL